MPNFGKKNTTGLVPDSDGYITLPGQRPVKIIEEDLGTGSRRFAILTKRSTDNAEIVVTEKEQG